MKKLLNISLLFSMSFLFLACDDNSTSINQPTTEIETTTELTTKTYQEIIDDQGIEFEILEYSNISFVVELTKVEFNIVERTITIDYDIKYPHPRTFYYFISRDSDSDIERKSSFSIDFDESKGSRTIDILDCSNYVTVEMGFDNRDDSIIRVYEETFTVGFKYRIADIESRGEIGYSNIYIDSSLENTLETKLSASVGDSNQVIDELRIIITDPNNDDYLVKDIVLSDIDSLRTTSGIIELDEMVIEGLTPRVVYTLRLYVSGSSGGYDFDNYLVSSRDQFTDGRFLNPDSIHGLYGAVYGASITETGLALDMEYINEGSYQEEGEIVDFYLNFYRYASDFEPYLSIKLDDMERRDFSVENTLLSKFDVVKIQNETRTKTIFNYPIIIYLGQPY